MTTLAAELDIRPDLVFRQGRESDRHKVARYHEQGNNIMAERQKETARLNKDIRDAQIECDIFKKAVSIFSKSYSNYSYSGRTRIYKNLQVFNTLHHFSTYQFIIDLLLLR
jgi:transposase